MKFTAAQEKKLAAKANKMNPSPQDGAIIYVQEDEVMKELGKTYCFQYSQIARAWIYMCMGFTEAHCKKGYARLYGGGR